MLLTGGEPIPNVSVSFASFRKEGRASRVAAVADVYGRKGGQRWSGAEVPGQQSQAEGALAGVKPQDVLHARFLRSHGCVSKSFLTSFLDIDIISS